MSRTAGVLFLAVFVCARSGSAADVLTVGQARADGSAAVEVIVRLTDNAGTRLGRDVTPIQALAFRVTAEPKEAVRAITFRRSGVLDRLNPQFEHSLKTPNSITYLVAFHSAKAPVALRSKADDEGDEIGRLIVDLAPPVGPGTAIRLSIDPLTATLSNEGGTISEQAGDGSLQLIDGAIVVP